MGDRASIQFKDEYGRVSAVLNDHWGGMGFVERAQDWLRRYDGDGKYSMPVPKGVSTPQSRKEASALMVEFIQASIGGDRVVPTMNDVDNSDNGHFILSTKDGSILEHLERKWGP